MTGAPWQRLHDSAIVIDAVCPLASDPDYLEWYRQGGVTALAPTIGSTEGKGETLTRLAPWHRLLRERDDLLLIRTASDIGVAKATGRLGIYFHFQGTDPIEDDLDLIDLYKSLGVGMIQLAYNRRNRVGDGCEESSDAGLSRFGCKLVERLNAARIIVDCSHTGQRTAMQAVERSAAPVVLSHSNVAAIHATPRNVSWDLIDAIAQSGGVIGVVAFPGLVAADPRPSIDQLIVHIDALVGRVGVDHVGLGLDYYSMQAGVASDDDALATYEQALCEGIWTSAYPKPPHHYPQGMEIPSKLSELTRQLSLHGYTEKEIRKILGENWLRIMKMVWG
ncbi:membrane dipeptidase [Sphingosinicella rhizophila]|uniref:Membrane dipeptidase n=1 Tax=Sphingosinicella rhizophila TaxID=3050082 RepID=A0ABU3Q4Y8_9SPHN|nr:membrane dipeptidase [Sphingosinicella sp. GR2756]MDT9598352.1 membrane dipeptidase [Sphingosinicella sp. GR2756]